MVNKTERYKELKQATYLSFQHRNKSLASLQLCNAVTHHLLALETRKRARKAKDMCAFKLTIELVLAGLIFAKTENESGWTYRGLGNDTFIGQPIKIDTFKKAIALLETAGYIELEKGSNHSNPFYAQGAKCNAFLPGLATRFRATQELLSIALQHGIEEDNYSQYYIRKLPTTVLKKKASSTNKNGQKSGGRQMKIDRDATVLRLEQQVKQINNYLDKQQLEEAIFCGYHRVFNMGDSPVFCWNKGGRLSCPGRDSYQRMKKQQRLARVKINGESVAEVDINASYLSIYHGMLGETLPNREDIYDIPGLHRDIVKAWITAAFGNNKLPTRWPSAAKKKLIAKGICMKKLTMTKVGAIVCEHIPIMEQLPSSGITWADLMYRERCAVIEAMESLRNNYDIPAYSMHDGLMVPMSASDVTTKEIIIAFKDLGISCRVTVETHE